VVGTCATRVTVTFTREDCACGERSTDSITVANCAATAFAMRAASAGRRSVTERFTSTVAGAAVAVMRSANSVAVSERPSSSITGWVTNGLVAIAGNDCTRAWMYAPASASSLALSVSVVAVTKTWVWALYWRGVANVSTIASAVTPTTQPTMMRHPARRRRR
jgi:hypothetical protein